ncbi:hypothetical protein EST38_g5723 [Candolleomyces aberdarensis]|uniref:Nephrocystin 3-like N-terminal domain-containing protein n=1 Tax=Candolleomyces aberdarensis TaxID=2316362 RepID=A0A4Q2DLG8_9AGAR|nr:hypothetical protein EST38_g5723 [Candolleomyces aberdarensis]
MTRNFDHAHDFHIDSFQVFNVHPSADPLNKLEGRVAVGAIHDSAERCDAPKCHPETRVALQGELYSWIVHGDGESQHPVKMKWVTGPAGSGKTAIMGSLAKRCAANGILGASFFFASWSASIARRRKTALVTTIAHQLTRYSHVFRDEIFKAIEANPDVFDKNLHVQMETLVLTPLREVAGRTDGPGLLGVIIIDGLDECEAEQFHDAAPTRLGAKLAQPRTNEQDQLEILQVLHRAASDPVFPFRILVASRPERVFREFFDLEGNSTPFPPKLDLNKDNNANADITLFMEAHFSRIRRRYNLPPSWPPSGAIHTLVENASQQFIYAAAVIQFLDTDHREPPEALLETILKMSAKRTTTSNPLEPLDVLYRHILESSPDPPLSIRWIHIIKQLNNSMFSPASNIRLLLQTDPESSEAEHLFGNLHSLIRVPPRSNQATAGYGFYHKSLLDFLQDPDRCGSLYVGSSELSVFIWDRFTRACVRVCDTTRFSYPQTFHQFLFNIPVFLNMSEGIAHSSVLPTPASVDWWVSSAISENGGTHLWKMFWSVHRSVRPDPFEALG